MRTTRLCAVVLAAIVALPVFADVVDDAIRLSQSGTSEEVMIAWTDHQHFGSLSTQDVLRLRDAKVPERVIAEMIRMEGTSYSSSTTREYVETPTYSYSTPYYYDSYPYYSYGYPYYGGYYGGYRNWGPSVGFNFRFGGGGGHHRR